VYSLFCVQSLTYLAYGGHLDLAQAIVGEMLSVTPFFILENGRLTPIQKARTPRHLIDTLHEFIAEFEGLKHVAIIQGVAPFDQEARILRDRLNGTSRSVKISEHTLNTPVATIFGPRCLGVVVMENCPMEI
jgi:fatty acid-binding protein DegV